MHPITERTAVPLVSFYCDTLAAMLDAPETFFDVVTRGVRGVIPCHGFVMVVEPDPHASAEGGRAEDVAHVRYDPGMLGTAPKIQMRPMEMERGRNLLEELITGAERDIVLSIETRYPDHGGIHVHWIRSDRAPRVAAGIFRIRNAEEAYGDYSAGELELMEEIAPHVLNCLHIYQELTRAQRATYDFFAERCSALAASSGLTSTEERVLRKMVEGAANKVISEDLGISLATVKTHISHILQKTGCRNRTDLIGRHFSSKHAAVGV
jgi:DNA-binding CsgD family transcriptional regulator